MAAATTNELFLDQDSYMNKNSGSKDLKCPVPEDSKACRMRSLEDILFGSSCQVMKLGSSLMSHAEGAEGIVHEATSAKDDDDFMTLQEMRHRVQKGFRKSKILQCREGIKLSVSADSSAADMDNAVPIMQLDLDSLDTDNGDYQNLPAGMANAATSNDKSKDGLHSSGMWTEQVANIIPPINKTKVELNEDVLQEEDEWMLHMWKTRLKQHPRAKRMKEAQKDNLKSISAFDMASETTRYEVGNGQHEVAEQSSVKFSTQSEFSAAKLSDDTTPDKNAAHHNRYVRESESVSTISTQQENRLQVSSEKPEIREQEADWTLKPCSDLSNSRQSIECSSLLMRSSKLSVEQLEPLKDMCPTDLIVLAMDQNLEQHASEQDTGHSTLVKNAHMDLHGVIEFEYKQMDKFIDGKSRTCLGVDESSSVIQCLNTSAESTREEKHKPSALLSKRKIISPVSREKLLLASRCTESGFSEVEGQLNFWDAKRQPWPLIKSCSSQGRESLNSSMNGASGTSPLSKLPQGEHGSPCHDRSKFLSFKSFLSKVASQSFSPPHMPSHHGSYRAQKLSLVLNASPSPPPYATSSPSGSSPPVPANKGILRISSQGCQGLCKCEECISVRTRAEKAVEFSQHQMHDIESLAVKLMKELSTMRRIVEDNVIQRSHSRWPALTPDQLKAAVNSAVEAEEMAKRWLVQMARDCKRYCKIMRMQQRRLSFADESGGQLCEVKVFHSQSNSVSTGENSLKPRL